MRMLAIETATEACSVALFEDGELVAARHEILGRGHAERLVPMIAELPGKGRAAHIRVSTGPGSFTGVRIGVAVARALAIAWDAEAAGYPTLPLVALQARGPHDGEILVCMTGGHGEWFVQPFDAAGRPLSGHRAVTPADAAAAFAQPLVVGSQADAFVALRGWGEARAMLPDAAAAAALPEALLSAPPAPLYGRPPDAKLPSR